MPAWPKRAIDLGLSAFELVEKMPALPDIQDLESAFYLSEATRGKTPMHLSIHPESPTFRKPSPRKSATHPAFILCLPFFAFDHRFAFGCVGGNRTENTTTRTTNETRPACSKENQEKTHRKSAFSPSALTRTLHRWHCIQRVSPLTFCRPLRLCASHGRVIGTRV